jgi:hypothetical protein
MLGKLTMMLMSPSLLGGLGWSIYIFLGYGLFELVRGVLQGYPPLTAVQCVIFNIYPLYIFFGLWIGQRRPGFLPKFVRFLAWWHGIYGVAYLMVLSHLPWTIPGTAEVELFGQPGGAAIAIIGLLSYERNLARFWAPLLMNAFVLLGTQVRAEWLGFTLSLVLWAILSRQLGKLLKGVGVIVIIIGIMFVTDFRLPSSKLRGGEISTREFFARAVAPLDPELAAKYTEYTEQYAGTASWRMKWWEAIWDSVHKSGTRTLFGYGYGFYLGSLVWPEVITQDTRTPHNGFFYALGYGGWIGVALFFTLQLYLLRLLKLAYRMTKQPFTLAFWLVSVTISCFGAFFETPFYAIPFYLIVGALLAPVQSSKESLYAHPHSA